MAVTSRLLVEQINGRVSLSVTQGDDTLSPLADLGNAIFTDAGMTYLLTGCKPSRQSRADIDWSKPGQGQGCSQIIYHSTEGDALDTSATRNRNTIRKGIAVNSKCHSLFE